MMYRASRIVTPSLVLSWRLRLMLVVVTTSRCQTQALRFRNCPAGSLLLGSAETHWASTSDREVAAADTLPLADRKANPCPTEEAAWVAEKEAQVWTRLLRYTAAARPAMRSYHRRRLYEKVEVGDERWTSRWHPCARASARGLPLRPMAA